jgi:putative DNA primase/helicase
MEYMYLEEKGGWYIYTGKRWEPDSKKSITKRIIEHTRAAQQDACDILDDDRRLKVLKWLMLSESKNKIQAVLDLMPSFDMSRRVADFDADDMSINCQNGVVDLKNGELLLHDRNRLKICAVKYVKEAKAPIFHAFLDQIMQGDQDKKTYIQKLLGYCLTGNIVKEEIYIAIGSGGNGKSKLFGVIDHIMNDYCITVNPKTILASQNETDNTNDIARMVGVRLILISEPQVGQKFDDSKIKRLTGGDTITARFLHKEFFEFRMTGKIILQTNHEIRVASTDNGMWRRPVIIPFTWSVPEGAVDPELETKLESESEGIFAWVVEGGKKYLAEGLTQTISLKEAKAEYRKGQDAIGLFLEECCIMKGDINATKLYKTFGLWAAANGEWACTQRAFGAKLKEKGCQKRKEGNVFYTNLSIKDNCSYDSF